MKSRTRLLALLGVLAAAASVVLTTPGTATAATPPPVRFAPTFDLNSVNNPGSVLGALSIANGSTIGLWQRSGTAPPQLKWRHVGPFIQDTDSGRCLDTANASTNYGTSAVIGQCNGTPTQQWVKISVGWGQFKLQQQGDGLMCLAVRLDGSAARAGLATCSDPDSSLLFSETAAKTYTGVYPPVLPGFAPTFDFWDAWLGEAIVASSPANGARLASPRPTSVRHWVQIGTYIQDAVSGRCLDLENGIVQKGQKVVIGDCTGSATQQWAWQTSTKVPGSYLLINTGTPGWGLSFYLEVTDDPYYDWALHFA